MIYMLKFQMINPGQTHLSHQIIHSSIFNPPIALSTTTNKDAHYS